MDKKHYCYLLQSLSNNNRTYVGYTKNPPKSEEPEERKYKINTLRELLY